MDPVSSVPDPGSGPDPGTASGVEPPIKTMSLQAPPSAVSPWAWGILALLFWMHVLVSIDRWVLAIVLPQLSDGLKLSEIQAGWLSTVLLLAFAISSPLVGYFADRIYRPRLLAIGFAIWSLATVATGLARSYLQLQAARAVVGVGGSDLRGRRPDDAHGLVSAHEPRPSAGVVLHGDAGGGGARIVSRCGMRHDGRLAVGISDRGCSRPRTGSGRVGTAGPGPRDE